MRLRVSALLPLLVLATPAPGRAQISDAVAKIIGAANLPVAADSARKAGVPSQEVRTAIDAMHAARLPADEARRVLDEARAGTREHGPVDNFGAFVQSKLAAGLRGRELAAAIRAEHAARGIGNARNAAGRGNATKGNATKGRPDAAGKSPDTDRRQRADTGARGRKSGPPDRPTQGGRPEGRGQSKRPNR